MITFQRGVKGLDLIMLTYFNSIGNLYGEVLF